MRSLRMKQSGSNRTKGWWLILSLMVAISCSDDSRASLPLDGGSEGDGKVDTGRAGDVDDGDIHDEDIPDPDTGDGDIDDDTGDEDTGDEDTGADTDDVTRGPTPWLHVEGNTLRDPSGNKVILRGASMMNIGQQEINGGVEWLIDKIVNPSDDNGGTNGWYPKVVRLPVYPPRIGIDPNNPPAHPYPFSDSGSETNEEYVEDFLRPAVDHARDRGLYAIIDFHQIADVDGTTDGECREFWSFVAPRFADDSHVIFEAFNEPMRVNGSSSWSDFVPYAQGWVDLIRAEAPDNLILMGGPFWSQNIGGAASRPLSGGNIAYVSHIYPEHWGGDPQRQAETCAGTHPVFMTEWGYDNDDSGFRDSGGYSSGLKDLINSRDMSWTAWCLSRDWVPRMLEGSLSAFELTDMGEFVKEWLYEERNNDLPE